ncbi:MAG: amidase [Alphaproteobacteria bacterium]|nr:amidase [Alphaproteobacteria bacterium]MCB9929334.1 amidase [Alphaproteobacteria bacterium]
MSADLSLTRMPAREVVQLLEVGEVSPLELIDAALARIEQVEPQVNALPTLCPDRARERARRLPARPPNARGWLGGLPVAIKDLMDVEGVRTTYASPIYKDHVPERSHRMVQRLEANGGLVLAKSNTPEFGAGGSTFNEVFGKTRNPWNTALTCGGSSGGAAVALATGEVWLAHGSDHGGSLRKPGSFCSVVGLRPSPGRVTRGTAGNLFSPSSVEGPMARDVPDLALFLDAISGRDPYDPLTLHPPAESFFASTMAALARGRTGLAGKRIGFTLDYGGTVPVARAVRQVTEKATLGLADLGCAVEEAFPALGGIAEAFQILRAQIFVTNRHKEMAHHRDQLKPDILWNTEKGLAQSPEQIGWAERERAAFYGRVVDFFETYDFLACPVVNVPPFDVDLRYVDTVDGVKIENYIAGSLTTSAISMTACPAISVPAGFDDFGRPIGLQLVGPPQDEAGLLALAAVFEEATGLAKLLPIDPRAGEVPPI